MDAFDPDRFRMDPERGPRKRRDGNEMCPYDAGPPDRAAVQIADFQRRKGGRQPSAYEPVRSYRLGLHAEYNFAVDNRLVRGWYGFSDPWDRHHPDVLSGLPNCNDYQIKMSGWASLCILDTQSPPDPHCDYVLTTSMKPNGTDWLVKPRWRVVGWIPGREFLEDYKGAYFKLGHWRHRDRATWEVPEFKLRPYSEIRARHVQQKPKQLELF